MARNNLLPLELTWKWNVVTIWQTRATFLLPFNFSVEFQFLFLRNGDKRPYNGCTFLSAQSPFIFSFCMGNERLFKKMVPRGKKSKETEKKVLAAFHDDKLFFGHIFSLSNVYTNTHTHLECSWKYNFDCLSSSVCLSLFQFVCLYFNLSVYISTLWVWVTHPVHQEPIQQFHLLRKRWFWHLELRETFGAREWDRLWPDCKLVSDWGGTDTCGGSWHLACLQTLGWWRPEEGGCPARELFGKSSVPEIDNDTFWFQFYYIF